MIKATTRTTPGIPQTFLFSFSPMLCPCRKTSMICSFLFSSHFGLTPENYNVLLRLHLLEHFFLLRPGIRHQKLFICSLKLVSFCLCSFVFIARPSRPMEFRAHLSFFLTWASVLKTIPLQPSFSFFLTWGSLLKTIRLQPLNSQLLLARCFEISARPTVLCTSFFLFFLHLHC